MYTDEHRKSHGFIPAIFRDHPGKILYINFFFVFFADKKYFTASFNS